MEHENANKDSCDYTETICPIQCDTLIKENQLALNEYIDFCSTRLVLPILNFQHKKLHLYGSAMSNTEAEKRFLEFQTTLLLESSNKGKAERIHWWYEGWDATWQLYNPEMINKIESHHKSNLLNFTIINDLGEKVSIDITKSEEIYGTRIKRIRRSKSDEKQPVHWTLTPLNLNRFLLDMQSNECLSIKKDFDNTMNGRYKTLISIERIQNIRLFKLFCASHEDFIVRYNKEDNGTMRFLYHGCPETASTRIIERGFNRSYCGINGCFYGRGVYFSANASYSDKYAVVNGSKEKRMFYSRVLIGRSMIGHASMCEPADGYDTTTDGGHIFVCYYDSQCYPEYLLTYL